MIETLPHHWYHDADIYQLECDHLFSKHWWLLGPEQALAKTGDYLAQTLMKRPLMVVRDQNTKLRGFYNCCRHRAGPLVDKPRGNCKEFVCRYHGWRYACSGELLKTPGLDPSEIESLGDLSLLPIRVESWNGMVFVCLDSKTVDLKTWLGDIIEIADAFDPTGSMTYNGQVNKQGQTNWKTYGDNSCEGYHVGMVHSALGSSMQRESVKIKAYRQGEFIGFEVNYASGKDQSRAGKGFWIYKFPGLLLHFADYSFNAESVIPTSANSIELQRWFWSNSDKAAQQGVKTETIRPNSEKVIDEDLLICEQVQRNLASGIYPGGKLSATQEAGTIYFQQLVRETLNPLL